MVWVESTGLSPATGERCGAEGTVRPRYQRARGAGERDREAARRADDRSSTGAQREPFAQYPNSTLAPCLILAFQLTPVNTKSVPCLTAVVFQKSRSVAPFEGT